MGEGGEGQRVVRVQHEEGRPARKHEKQSSTKSYPDPPAGVGEEVSREEAAVFLDRLSRGLDLPARSHQHSSQVVTGVLGHWTDWEGAVGGDVEEEGTWSLGNQ